MKHIKNVGQQGDVTFKRVDNLPKPSMPAKRDPRGIVLAEGEATGHCHVIEETEDAVLYQEGERMLLQLEKQAVVKHAEHKPVTLTPGIWEIGRVREYDYIQELERRVQD